MANSGVYAIGDLQGCLRPMKKLIKQSSIDLEQDQLWLVGDLVNRGPQSLKTLRFVKSLSDQMGDRCKVVLGNHDLHLLALAYGVKKPSPKFGLAEVLKAPDKIELIEWLRHRPLMVRDTRCKAVLVHAGIYPKWKINKALSYAQEVEQILQGKTAPQLLKKMYGKRPTSWNTQLEGWARYRFIINAMTRMRYCTRNGGLNFSYKGPLGTQSKKFYPWYQLALKSRKNWRIVFGHWAAAGAWFDGNHIALDSGCVWGESMTIARIDQRLVRLEKVSCARIKAR